MDPNSDIPNNTPTTGNPGFSPQQMPSPPSQQEVPKSNPVVTPAVPPSMPQTPTMPSSINSEPVDVSMGSQPPMEPEHKSNKLLFVIIMILVIILVALAGVFVYQQYFSSNLVETGAPLNVNQNSAQPTSGTGISPTLTPVNEEEGELQKIQITPAEGDLKGIEQEINQL